LHPAEPTSKEPGMPSYPQTPTGPEADACHGESVPDPYRWLEDAGSPATAAWIEAENALTESWLASVPSRAEISARLAQLWDYPRYGVPIEAGGRLFQFRNSGLEPQPVLYVMESTEDDGEVLLDPNSLSSDGTVAVTSAEPSRDGALLVYSTASAGSDWLTWHVRRVADGSDLPDLIEWSKFTGAVWKRDGTGYFYGAPAPPEPGREYEGETRALRVLFHRLGTDQSADEVVFAAPDEPDWLPRVATTDDGRYLVIAISRGTAPESQLHVIDLEQPSRGLRPLVDDFSVEASVVANIGERFLLLTNDSCERRRIVAAELGAPERSNWQEVIGETEETLVDARQSGPSLVCCYLRDACSVLRVHELEGELVREIPLPPYASLVDTGGGFVSGHPDADVVYFKAVSYTEPGSIWSHDLLTGDTQLVRSSTAHFDSGRYVTERVLAPSADGTQVPILLSRRQDVTPSGERPVLLYGYGGFNVPLTPTFSAITALWMERGGVYAAANLRGGGEYGRAWHHGGRLQNKQHVFDDFCACARYLVDSGWSRPNRIAINGASNGGLVVGACLTQHPELFGAAVPEVGVLDMLRFHKFTIGWAWTSDFGDPDDPEQYRWLRAYSPLHNVGAGTNYPATFIVTGDHDDRVIPGHSFKFAAAMQAAQGGDAPVLIRIETSAGHGRGKPTNKQIAEGADILTFLEAALGLAQEHPVPR
jgi:prolyl oligopeptidase